MWFGTGTFALQISFDIIKLNSSCHRNFIKIANDEESWARPLKMLFSLPSDGGGVSHATLIYNLWRWISDSEYTKFDISSKALDFVKSNKCSKLKHKLEKEKNVPQNSFKLQLHVLNLVSEGKRNSCATMYEDWTIDEMGQPQF